MGLRTNSLSQPRVCKDGIDGVSPSVGVKVHRSFGYDALFSHDEGNGMIRFSISGLSIAVLFMFSIHNSKGFIQGLPEKVDLYNVYRPMHTT